MALYEYQCAACHRKTEVIQRFSDPPPTICPHCGGALKKLLSSPAVQFKGSGFYATDYGKPGAKDGESSSKVKEGGGDVKSEGGAESKGDSAGQSAKDSKDSSKERDSSKGKSDSGPSTAAEAGAKHEAPGSHPSSPSKKNIPRK